MVREQRHANASDGTYSYGARYNVSYLELLASSRLFLTVTGDCWAGGNLWQALEFGVIPVVEARPSYKGCEDPTGWSVPRARARAASSFVLVHPHPPHRLSSGQWRTPSDHHRPSVV